jgi:hypothetical protein
MAQDPGLDQEDSGRVDPSPDLDLVTLFSSSNTDAEMEADNIHQVLEASGVFSVIEGSSVIPSLEFQVLVPRARFEEAERLVREARAAGPAAAAEAEAASEEGR